MIVVEGEEIAKFVEGKLGIKFSPPYVAFGFLTNDKRPLSAFVFNEFNNSNIEATIFAERGGINRAILRYIANYVFVKCKCRRLTVRTKKRNKRVLKIAPRFGFTYESVAKHHFTDDDAVVFRMLKEDCVWL